MDGPDWRTKAPCRSAGDTMWPDRYDSSGIQRARRVCSKCPKVIRYQCLTVGDEQEDFASVRSGLTGEQRRRLTEQGADYPMLVIRRDGTVDPVSLGELVTLNLEHPQQECTKCGVLYSPRTRTQRRCAPCSFKTQSKAQRSDVVPIDVKILSPTDLARVATISPNLLLFGPKIEQWKAEGLSDSSIGAKLGMSVSTVRRIRIALGIPKLTVTYARRNPAGKGLSSVGVN